MSELAAGAVIAGKYRLEREIGRGGMGSVWAARHLQLDTLIALKFIDASAAAADAHLRFEREAKAAAQLRSPHVVQILDHGVDGVQPYIAMELLEGEDLGQRLRRVGRLSIREASTILGQAAKALRRAHEAGVIHRDLKPSNIFLARFDDDEVVKLLDFGVAKLRHKEMDPQNLATQTGVIFGSPTYMSPEQARGNKPIDHRSDLWSLAVILFRVLTGSKPFEASSIGDLVIKLCFEPPPVPSKVAPDLPPEIDAFFDRAFAREPEQRFQSAMAMAAELDAIAQRDPRRSGESLPAALDPRPSATPPSGMSPAFSGPTGTPGDALAGAMPKPDPAPNPLPVPSQPTPISSSFQASLPTQSQSAPDSMRTPATGVLRIAPPSMTPSPALLAPRAAPPASSQHAPFIVAGVLALGAFVLLVVVIGVLRTRAPSDSPQPATPSDPAPIASAPIAFSASTTTPAIDPPIDPPTDPSTDPAIVASALPDPSAEPASSNDASDARDPPANSASTEASARVKPPPGKTGRGRVPNFGY